MEEMDAAVIDSGAIDAGMLDAGMLDAGMLDAGMLDAGMLDAGMIDAGAIDSGVIDASVSDSGDFDAGDFDAGEPDAGEPDAGEPDAGEFDAGEFDAGEIDAGAIDAGLPWPLGTWDLVFLCRNNCVGTWPHTMVVTHWDPATGAFSGFGSSPVDPTTTWTVTTGTISPPSLNFTLVYTGQNPNYTAVQTGLVYPNGSIAGISTTSQNQTLDWAGTRRP